MDLPRITQFKVSSHFQSLSSVSISLPRRREGAGICPEEDSPGVSCMGKPLTLLGLPSVTSSGPPLGQALPPLPQEPLSCSLRVRGPERRPQHSAPRWTPHQWDSEEGECWVLTSQNRESGATAMQASWGPSSTVQMSQECAELGTTSLLPSPPPTLHPLICLPKLCLRPTPFLFLPSSFIYPCVHCPSGTLPQSSSLSDL